MKCCICDRGEYVTEVKETSKLLHGVRVLFVAEVQQCTGCKHYYMTDEQREAYHRAADRKYEIMTSPDGVPDPTKKKRGGVRVMRK